MSPSRPVVVLLHGVGLDHSVWDAVVPLLDPAYDVRCPDLPGHGVGPRVPDAVDLAGLAALALDQVPDGAHVVGFSLGALIAQHVAIHHPQRVASLTSVSSVCRRTDEERAAVLRRLADAETGFEASAEASLHRWYDGTDVPEETVAHTRRVLLANDVEQYLRCYRVFATGDTDVAGELPRIAVPSLAVTGSDDPGSTPDMTRRLSDALPRCQSTVVAGARHMLPVQCPEVLASSINDLIGGRVHV